LLLWHLVSHSFETMVKTPAGGRKGGGKNRASFFDGTRGSRPQGFVKKSFKGKGKGRNGGQAKQGFQSKGKGRNGRKAQNRQRQRHGNKEHQIRALGDDNRGRRRHGNRSHNGHVKGHSKGSRKGGKNGKKGTWQRRPDQPRAGAGGQPGKGSKKRNIFKVSKFAMRLKKNKEGQAQGNGKGGQSRNQRGLGKRSHRQQKAVSKDRVGQVLKKANLRKVSKFAMGLKKKVQNNGKGKGKGKGGKNGQVGTWVFLKKGQKLRDVKVKQLHAKGDRRGGNPKEELFNSMRLLLGRNVTKDDFAYEHTEEKGRHTATLTISALETERKEFQGKPAKDIKAAEQLAAQKCLNCLQKEINEARAVRSAAKKEKFDAIRKARKEKFEARKAEKAAKKTDAKDDAPIA
jgi:hypothetical protein